MSIKTTKEGIKKLVYKALYEKAINESSDLGEMMQVATQIADKLKTEVELQAQNRAWDPEQLYQAVVSQFKQLKSMQAKREE